MKVLHIVSSLEVGGAERFVIDLASLQVTQGVEVSILSFSQSSGPLELAVGEEITVTYLKGGVLARLWQLTQIFKRFDVVHLHTGHGLLPTFIAKLLTTRTPKLIYTKHNEAMHTSIRWRLSHYLAHYFVDSLIFVAEKAAQTYLAQYESQKSKTKVILNGVLPISTEKECSQKVRLGIVGRFVELKGHHYLLRAAALLPDSIRERISIHFYGTGPLLESNRELAQDILSDVEVNFHGFEQDREKIYSGLDILVVTSETEGLSLAILESLASATPVVASKVGGNVELVKHEVNGLLYEYADTPALASCIQRLIENQGLAKKLSLASYDKFLNEFSMEQCVKSYLSSYQDTFSTN